MDILHITGRRWFERRNGNTYHTCSIYVNGEHVHTTPDMAYGYGEQYVQTAQAWLLANEHLPGYVEGTIEPYTPSEALWVYCDRMGIKKVFEVIDVGRKRDL